MENTDELFFEKNKAEWFVCVNETWLGPLTPADIMERINKDMLSAAHFVIRQGEKKWQRISDVKSFASLMPGYPSAHVLSSVQEQWTAQPSAKKGKPAKPERSKKIRAATDDPSAQSKEWFLYFNRTQTGPFSPDEIMRLLSVGKIDGKVFTWRDGMSDWIRLKDIQLFRPEGKSAQSGKAAKPAKSAASPAGKPLEGSDRTVEMREGMRRPLVARIVMANKNQVTAGICRDISVGGMQVLTDQIPGDVGTILKINISPIGSEELRPFVADGEVVRILEDGRGFSFRFHQLSDDSRATIEKYLGIKS